MPSAGKLFSSVRLLNAAMTDVRKGAGDQQPMLLCGRSAPLDVLIDALGAEGSQAVQLFAVRRLTREDSARLSQASVAVYGGEVLSGLDEQTRSDLEVVGRAKAPKLAMLEALDLPSDAIAAAGRVRGVEPHDVMPYRQGHFPVNRAMDMLAERVGSSGPWVASQVPALRQRIVEGVIEAAARRNAKAALMIFVPGADMPVLTAVQMRMVLQIAACHGQEVSADRALELLSVLGAGFGFRMLARSALDFIPVAGWAVQSGIAYSATRAVGTAADEYFGRGAVADVSKLRAIAEGLRYELEEQIRKRRAS
jgi:uncharacterized protein (DUF697 family)